MYFNTTEVFGQLTTTVILIMHQLEEMTLWNGASQASRDSIIRKFYLYNADSDAFSGW